MIDKPLSTAGRPARIELLRLRNFRSFADIVIPVGLPLTVLAGVNGSGKSSIIDALEIATSHLIPATLQNEQRRELTDDDVQRGNSECSVRIEGPGFALTVRHVLGQGTTREPTEELFAAGDPPPLVINLGVNRSMLKRPLWPPSGSGTFASIYVRSARPLAAWDDVRNPEYTSFEHLEFWFREREDIENQERVRKKDFDYADRDLLAVRRAIEGLLPGYQAPRIDRTRPSAGGAVQFVLRKADVELAANQLSDGERSLMVLGATIARRLALLDQAAEDPLQGEALIAIDEVDLHLHPKWQREVVGALRRAFPRCRLLLTTHSPQVLGELKPEEILISNGSQAWRPRRSYGIDSSRILEELMGASSRASPVLETLRSLFQEIDAEKMEAARRTLAVIEDQLGPDDPDVTRARALISFLEQTA